MPFSEEVFVFGVHFCRSNTYFFKNILIINIMGTKNPDETALDGTFFVAIKRVKNRRKRRYPQKSQNF